MVTEVQLFGALKKFSPSGKLVLELPDFCRVSELRSFIIRELSAQFPVTFHSTLVDCAVLANESQVLTEDVLIAEVHSLALLPPVCGG